MSYGSYCCVVWCANNGKTKKPHVKVFRIPRDPRSKAWLQYARRPELLGKTAKELYEGYRLCSELFTAKAFLDPGKTRLTKTAIPTVRPQMLRPSVTSQEEPVATTCPCDVPLEGNRMSHPTAAYEKPMSEPSPGDVRLEGSRTSPSTAAHEGPMVAPSPGNVPLEGSGTSPLAAAHKQPLAAPSPGNVPLEGSGMSPSTAAREGPMAAPSPGNVPMESSGTSPLAAVHEEPVATCPCDVPLEGSRTSPSTAAHEGPMVAPSPGNVPLEGSGTSPLAAAHKQPLAAPSPGNVPLEGSGMSPSTAAREGPMAAPSPGNVPMESSGTSPLAAVHEPVATCPCDVPLEGSRTSPSTAAHEGPMVAPSPGNVPLEGSGTSPLAAAHKQPLAAPSPGNVPLEGSGMSPSTAAREGPMAAPSPGNVPMESSGTSPLAAVHEEPVATCPCDVPLEGSRTSHPTAASEKPMAEPSPGDVRMEGSGTSPSAAAHEQPMATSPCGISLEGTSASHSIAACEQMGMASSPGQLLDHSTPPSSVGYSESSGTCSGRSTPASAKLSRRPRDVIKRLQAKFSSYRKTISRLRKQQKQMPQTAAEALEMVRPFVTEEVFGLISSHVKLGRKGRGKRFPLWFKKFALHLNFHGPQAYRFLSLHLTLPTQRSLRTWLSNVKMTPGIIPGVMSSIESQTRSWNARDRVWTLIFDEIVLKKNLTYDPAHDIIHGLADDGVERTSTIADRALVVVLSGLSRRWVQPLAYTVGHTSTPSSVIRSLLISLIRELKTVDFTVKAVVCDQGASNVSLANQLGVSADKPFFEVDNEHVYFIFDVPHLIKTTRNNLQAHNLCIGDEVIEWSHIVELYRSTHEMRLRLAPKLTKRHIFQKPFSNMKVKRATQVLSASVCLAILSLVYAKELPEAAMATAYFCDRMDRLFDCLNSSQFKKTGQKLRHAILKGESEILDFLHQQLAWISTWKFQSRRQPQTTIGWQVTIRSVLMLWDELSNSYDFKFLLTRRLQQDPLENIFGAIRQMLGCNTNPNVNQFTSGLKHIGIKKLFRLSNNGNVEDEKADLLKELPIFSHHESSIADNVECFSVDKFPPLEDISELASDIRSNIIDDSCTYYVGGYLIKLFLEQTTRSCGCSKLLKDESDNLTRPHQYFLVLKAYHVPGKLFGNLVVPSQAAFNFIQKLENHFLAVIERVAHVRGVCAALYHTLSELGGFSLCSQECHKRFLKMFCRIRLCWHVRFLNRNLGKVRLHSSVASKQLDKFNC
ncbi:uncharacterized protein LOC121836326 isoform X3 [Ixodes scapularis]|uniref:uncharacterized protein LOC121836326 isoform X3 n=1 Tax=Ixodes scapularis TaxID=6945 RepID=UPI001C38A2DD|nr:uncharacterized protein LOC121836326 isoform X3 [Ixodes scapularis]